MIIIKSEFNKEMKQFISKLKTVVFLKVYLLLALTNSLSAQNSLDQSNLKTNQVTIVDRTGISNDAEHAIAIGKRALFGAIQNSGSTIKQINHWTQTDEPVHLILGTLQNRVLYRLVSNEPLLREGQPEGVFYLWREIDDRKVLVIGGTDEKGLMYALTEVAEQIKHGGVEILKKIKDNIEFPKNSIRGVDKFLTDENDDSWFFSEAYWKYYINQLAINRFNRFTLITGYNEGKNEDFMIPVYPYLVDVEGFEGVRPRKNLDNSPEDYLNQLRRIGELCHSHGIEFIFGMWGHGKSEELVVGLPENSDAYTQYCADGMRELLRKAPEIDGIQLRVNYESGVGGFGETAELFWKKIIMGIGDVYKERQGKLTLDLRAKGLTPKMRDWVLETGMDLNVTSKYTWEGVGLPFHPTQMRQAELSMLKNIDKRQRYGYADFLNHSRNYDFIYRLWGIGTTRIFTWADPDYVKRFSQSTNFGDSRGFQVTPPMARKQNTWNLIKNKALTYYEWEDQRYWAYYLLFGRLGYSFETDREVWERVFREHYGSAFNNILNAYSSAGKVLPLITSSHLTVHPANYNWAEMDSGGALFSKNNTNPFHRERTYQTAEPGDPGLFYSIEPYVTDVLEKNVQPKIGIVQLVALYEYLANDIIDNLEAVKKADIPQSFKKEYMANEVDLKITAALAAYHSNKTKAATDYVFFEKTHNKGYLVSSLDRMNKVLKNWKTILALTETLYHQNPKFLYDNGTWHDRLVEIEKDIIDLEGILGDQAYGEKLSHWDKFKLSEYPVKVDLEAVVPKNTGLGKENLKLTLKSSRKYPSEQCPKVHYRLADMTLGPFKQLKMEWNGQNYVAQIPKKEFSADYDLLVYFTTIENDGTVHLYPGIFNEHNASPYFIISNN